MANIDHAGYKKIQCWIPETIWDKIESLGYPNQTSAVTEAFDLLLTKSQNIPNESQNIPELRATIEGLQLLLQEKDERINDLHRETETLSAFAHYFKSIEYRRLEASTEERMIVSQESDEKSARETGRAHTQQEEIGTQEPERKQASRKTRASTGKGEKALIEKTCKNCNQTFLTDNPKKETCSSKCRSSYSRRKTVN